MKLVLGLDRAPLAGTGKRHSIAWTRAGNAHERIADPLEALGELELVQSHGWAGGELIEPLHLRLLADGDREELERLAAHALALSHALDGFLPSLHVGGNTVGEEEDQRRERCDAVFLVGRVAVHQDLDPAQDGRAHCGLAFGGKYGRLELIGSDETGD